MKTLQIIVSGRVQGVYFRAYIQKHAIKLGITGFAKNNKDGSVEIIACGGQENLKKFITYCYKGPIMAKVNQVIANEYDTNDIFAHFDIR